MKLLELRAIRNPCEFVPSVEYYCNEITTLSLLLEQLLKCSFSAGEARHVRAITVNAHFYDFEFPVRVVADKMSQFMFENNLHDILSK